MPSDEVIVVDLIGLLRQELTVGIVGCDVSMHGPPREIPEPRLCHASYIGTAANRLDYPCAAHTRGTF